MNLEKYLTKQSLIECVGVGVLPAPILLSEEQVTGDVIPYPELVLPDRELYEVGYTATLNGDFIFEPRLKAAPVVHLVLRERLCAAATDRLSYGEKILGLQRSCSDTALLACEKLLSGNRRIMYYADQYSSGRLTRSELQNLYLAIKKFNSGIKQLLMSATADLEFSFSPEHSISLYDRWALTICNYSK